MHGPLRVSALIASEPHAGDLTSLTAPDPVRCYPSGRALLDDGTVEPGLVLVGPPHGLAEAAALARGLRARGEGWVVVLAEPDPAGSAWTATPVTVGYGQPLDRVVAAALGRAEVPLLELTPVLAHVARASHDINNPLTSALAETQLLLMDVGVGEVREGLEAIQRQIRRIRDLVADLSALRPPS